jgi:hypothetical protein
MLTLSRKPMHAVMQVYATSRVFSEPHVYRIINDRMGGDVKIVTPDVVSSAHHVTGT